MQYCFELKYRCFYIICKNLTIQCFVVNFVYMYSRIRLFSCVASHVNLHTLLLCKTFVALRTFPGFLSSVGSYMALHVGFRWEGFTTFTTLVWFLPIVHTHMDWNNANLNVKTLAALFLIWLQNWLLCVMIRDRYNIY